MISALTGKYPCFSVKWFSLLFSVKVFPDSDMQRERERRERREIANPKTDSNSDKPRNWLCLTQKTQDRENPFDHTQKTHSIKPRNPIHQTQKTHSIAPSQTLIAPTAPPARLSHPSIDPPKTDRSRRTPKAIILMLFLLGIENLGFVSFVSFGFWWIWVLSSTQLRHPHSSNPVASLSLSLSLSQFDQIWWIVFVGICFFCVYLLRNDINICLEDEKMWETW